MSSNNIALCRSVNEELSVNYMGFLYFCRMNYYIYKQCALLLWLVASVVGAVASSCGSCEYFDRLIEECSPCNLICPLELNRCKRLCLGKYHQFVGSMQF